MDRIFDLCVEILKYLAQVTGLTYKEINVWIFVIIHPAITLILALIIVVLIFKRAHRKSIESSAIS